MRGVFFLTILSVFYFIAASHNQDINCPQDVDKEKMEDISKVHTKIYKKLAPAVVGVTYGVEKRGTGVVIDSDGLIITHTLATGLENTEVYVYLKGHRRVKASVVYTSKDKDLAVLKIDVKDLTTIELGDSNEVKIGQTAYVLGDSFNSIFTDDQVAMSVGIISGTYEIKEPQLKNSSYKGPVLETSAAVNWYQAGAPLINSKGKLIGMVTLDYEKSKFTGIAIPINELKPLIEEAKSNLKKKRRVY